MSTLAYVFGGALALACAQPVYLLVSKSDRLARLKGSLRGRRAVLPPQTHWKELCDEIQSPDDAQTLLDQLDHEIRARSYAPIRELVLLDLFAESLRLHLNMLAIEQARLRELQALEEAQRQAAEMERMRQVLEEQARRAREQAREEARKRTQAAQARSATGWRRVLNLEANEKRPDVVKRAYRSLAQRYHPDKGGSENAMTELNRAYASARKELGFR
jgi:hypothetical protein